MKIVDEILHGYYCRRLAELVEANLINWTLDWRLVKTKYSWCYEVKRREFNDKEYRIIYSFAPNLALFHLIRFEDKDHAEIKRAIERYCEETR